jgi:hypothetical protein
MTYSHAGPEQGAGLVGIRSIVCDSKKDMKMSGSDFLMNLEANLYYFSSPVSVHPLSARRQAIRI